MRLKPMVSCGLLGVVGRLKLKLHAAKADGVLRAARRCG
jgi:hypothetical protein